MRAIPARLLSACFLNSVLPGLMVACLLAGAPRSASAQTGGPLPYAPIANPLPDTMDQLYRDSLNLKFSKIRVNQAGYRTTDRKFFYTVGATGTAFQVINEGKAQVATGTLTPTGQSTSGQLSIYAALNAFKSRNKRYTMLGQVFAGAVSEGEIPASVPAGRYRIVAGADTSSPFVVDDKVYSWVKDALLKFFGANRDGNADSWFHPPSHLKDGPSGDGTLTGGWFDCGDHLKESMSMSYATAMLGMLAAALPDRDGDHYGKNHSNTYLTDGVPDILYETKIGTDFYLKSYDLAKGDPSKMITSIGAFGGDHGWWGQPQFQDALPPDRGGPVRELRSEVGSNIMGRLAAGFAFFSKQYAPFDKPYADRCLAAAKKFYDFGKANYKSSGSSGAYPTETSINDDMALAAVALLWATRDTTYKFDLIANPALGKFGNPYFTPGSFPGGWMVNTNTTLQKGGSNTSYANLHTPVLWAFYRLILKDPATAAACGITADQRLGVVENVVFQIIDNLGWLKGGSATLDLPGANPQLSGGHTLTYDPLWKINTKADVIWVWNRYIAGNSAEFFCYYDVAKDLQGIALPHTPASVDWKADEVRQLIVRQMDYMLGVNPWDISMVYGVGSKNFNHPHHRGSNPEGTNVPGAFYKYRPPVGALQGGFPPTGGNGGSAGLYTEDWEDYTHSESCLDGTSTLLFPVLGLANEDTVDALGIQVRIEYVGTDHAIIVVRPSRYGTATIRYGTSAAALTSAKAGDSAAIEHRIVLTGLTPGTVYYFQAEATDLKGRTGINDNGGNKFMFTTLAQPPGAAQIAQVKVCNVTDKTAEILWFTPNGAYDSKVVYGTGKPPTQVHDGDVTGHPVKFHYVILDSLKEKTQYWFYVESNGVRDDNQGQFYTFTTKIQHVEFDVRALTYDIGAKKYLGFNIVNQDIKSYDSLDVRLYMRATDAQMADFGVRADIGQAYLSTGYLDPTNAFKTALDMLIQKVRPVRMDETFDAASNTYFWYVSLPMANARMASGARFRVDVTFVKRNEHNDLLDEPATYVPSSKDWSWSVHSRAQGDPVDFGGVKPGTKEDVDDKYVSTEVDPYITVYRKGQFVWGYSPSSKEQATKVSNYRMDVQITSPLNNPPEDYKKLDQASSTAIVKGKVAISDAGKLTDIWVNGERVANLAQVAAYDAAANAWNLNVPIKLKAGPNEVDLTLFGGADPDCQGCVGCAFANRHFYLEYTKANASPSTLTLLTSAGQPVPPLAVIGQTGFIVEVQDKNGDLTANADQLQVKVSNPNQGDILQLTLAETGPRTGVFRSAVPVLVLDLPPASTGAGQIAMSEGDSVWVTYVDPTDADDSSRAFLYTPATFPQAVSGWLLDSDGDGAADKAVVNYSMALKTVPDSLQLWFPDASAQKTFASAAGGFTLQETRVEVVLAPPFATGVTAFTGDNRNSGRSFLTHEGKPRVSAFTLADSIGPVLMRAVLAPASVAGAPDTLTATFSEPIAYARAEIHPFQGKQGGILHPASEINVAGTVDLQSARLILLLNPESKLLLAPGDSLRIAAGIADLPGNRPAANNRFVLVEGEKRLPPAVLDMRWDTRIYDSRWSGPEGKPFVLSAQDAAGNWVPVQGAVGSIAHNCTGSDCGQPLSPAADGSVSLPSILIASDRPFRYESVVFNNFGVFVAGISGEVGATLLDGTGGSSAPVHADPKTGHYRLRLIWNGKAVNGTRAGTGAYVWKATLLSTGGGKPTVISSTKTIGLLRRD
ncbi:MAG: glycoside hydrolase family 9 protein [Fibrobacteria bacterium]